MVTELVVINIKPKTKILLVDVKSKDYIHYGYVDTYPLRLNLESGREYLFKASHSKYEQEIYKLEVNKQPFVILALKQKKLPTWIDKMKNFIFKHKH